MPGGGGSDAPGRRRRPTIDDVAARAGVSAASVSFAMNDRPGVGAETRERIFAAARKNKVAFLEGAPADQLTKIIDEGVRVIAGQKEETARIGREHSKRTMPY